MGRAVGSTRRGRWRVRAMWTTGAVAAVFLAAEIASLSLSMMWAPKLRSHWLIVDAGSGLCAIEWSTGSPYVVPARWTDRPLNFRHPKKLWAWPSRELYTVQRLPLAKITVYYVTFPLWLPALAAAIPAALLWRAGRRRVPGACGGCGYDLSGNTCGPCPECGKAAA
jgi:hypothetical protein